MIRNVDVTTSAAAITEMTTNVESSAKIGSMSSTFFWISSVRTDSASRTVAVPATSVDSSCVTAVGAAPVSNRTSIRLNLPPTSGAAARSRRTNVEPKSSGVLTTPVTVMVTGAPPCGVPFSARIWTCWPTRMPSRSAVFAETPISPGLSG